MSFFEKLGRLAGQAARKGKWVYQSLAGDEQDALQAEYAVGQDLANETRTQVEVDPDPDLNALVDGVGQSLAAWVNHPGRRFAFTIYAATEVNGFALPGGFIFLTRPLVQMCLGNRDELAFVLGHEMAHVIRGHVLDRMIVTSVINAASRAVPIRGPVGGVIRSTATQYIQKSYSREQELESDILGVRLARAAGFDPYGAVRLLEHLREVVPKHDSIFTKYFSTHPMFDERVSNLKRFLDRALPQ